MVARTGSWIALTVVLAACAEQGTQDAPPQPAAAPARQPAPAPAAAPRQPGYTLSGGTMIVVTEPVPEVRRTTAALDLVKPKTLLDVARQATVRVANADAGSDSVINAVDAPLTDIALGIERALLERLIDTFSLPTRVTQVEDPQRSFPFTAEGAATLSGQIRGAGLGGYVLDVRTNYLDLETTGGTIGNPVENFSLSGQVAVRLIDVSDGRVIRQAVCTDKQPMGTLRDIYVAEGKPVPDRIEAAAEPEPAPEDTASGEPKPEDETSAEALALIEKTDGSTTGQPISDVPAGTEPVPPDADAEAEAIAQEAASAVTEPLAAVEPVGQPTPEDRVQQALREAPAAQSEVAGQAPPRNAQTATDEPSADVPLRRTEAFSGVVQEALSGSPSPGAQSDQSVTVQTEAVKQKARLPAAALAAAQATGAVNLPGPGASGRVSDGAAERLIRICTEDLWWKIRP